jgi:nitroimidazol reductase NimA-like FMN-containing flavoprotein (pyridoxamine 5'-phosphate oxidase superfamily)
VADPEPPTPTLEELTRDECLALLASAPIGRVAVAQGDAAPLVVPVNFVVDGDVIVFRTDAGAKLTGLQAGPISFEVDDADPFRNLGWSVLVRGTATIATPAEVEHLDLAPWVGGPKPHWVRLPTTDMTGRRVRVVDGTVDLRGYL